MKWMDRERSFWVIGGDLRQRALARLLREDGHTVHIAGLEGEGLEPEPLGPGLALAHCVILPLPVAVGESFVHTPLSAARLPLAQVLDCLRPGQLVCGVPEDRTRWILDDALKFVQREARRGHFYDGILMDPPSYGRGPGGEVWKLENELYGLVKSCSEALSDDPLFFLINGYTTGFQASVLGNMIDMCVTPRFGGVMTADEVGLPVTAGGVLPCGASGRWQRAGV